MLVAGEASGDQHAANLFVELKKRVPAVRGIGMGGQQMAQAGIDLRFDSSNIGVIGLIEIIRHYGEIRSALKLMEQTVEQERPDLLICIDYKEFNYKLAKHAKACGIKVLFYVSPQVWAWRPGRVVKYGRAIDMMAVIFPFEVPYYQRENVPVRFVGHPLAEKVHPTRDREAVLEQYQLNPQQLIIGLLPGSRANEIKRILPLTLATAKRLGERFPGIQFVLLQADTVADSALEEPLKPFSDSITVVKGDRYNLINCCDAVICTSGTATLEVALLGIPMVIVYRLAWVTSILGGLLIKQPFIGLPNIVAGRRIVEEFIQHKATPKRVFNEIEKILTDHDYAEAQRQAFKEVKQKLGAGGGSKNMAELAQQMLNEKSGC